MSSRALCCGEWRADLAVLALEALMLQPGSFRSRYDVPGFSLLSRAEGLGELRLGSRELSFPAALQVSVPVFPSCRPAFGRSGSGAALPAGSARQWCQRSSSEQTVTGKE